MRNLGTFAGSEGRAAANGYGMRSAYPTAWPQYPFDAVPKGNEGSIPVHDIRWDSGISVAMSDGVELLLDVYRPSKPGLKVPALCSISPYSRQLQRDSAPIGQNEAGISEFWVPRGYAHVIVDVRGTNGSGGDWDMWGPVEQQDLAEVIEWVAAQPWCTGAVGMMGCSYFGMVQNLAAAQQPPSLRAVFPYDALTDLYRDALFPGGIPNDWARFWFTQVVFLNGSSGRTPDMRSINAHLETIYGLEQRFDGPYYRERSAWPVLERVEVPAYFGCDWDFHALHLRGAFDAWQRVVSPTKRMLIGPKPYPGRPFAAYHGEALRWYDQFLKEMDTGVLDEPPIQLWVPGLGRWRSEHEWPLARTRFEEWFLTPASGGSLADTAPETSGELTLDCRPDTDEWELGLPSLVFRSPVLDAPIEVTGPIELVLVMSSTAEDADWIVILQDEGPDRHLRELTRGHLRSSHRQLDEGMGRPGDPWHPHDKREPLEPGTAEELCIGLAPTSNLFETGHRIRIELANSDSGRRPGALTNYRRTLRVRAVNTVITGRRGSRIILPVIP